MLKRVERLGEFVVTIGLSLIASVLLALIGSEATGRALFDRYQHISPMIQTDQAARVVLIDPESLKAVGPWPWPRYVLARLTEEIAARGAVAIGFDLIFPEPDRFNASQFAALYPDLPPQARAAMLEAPTQDATMAQVIGRHPVVLGRIGLTRDAVDFAAGAQTDPTMLALNARFSRPLPPGVLAFPGALTNIKELDEVVAGQALLNGAPDSDGGRCHVNLQRRHLGERNEVHVMLQPSRLSTSSSPPPERSAACDGKRDGAGC